MELTTELLRDIQQGQMAILQRITALETLVANQAQNCPHRETIARSQNNREQIHDNTDAIEKLGERLTGVQIKMGGITASVSLGVGIITAVIMQGLGL